MIAKKKAFFLLILIIVLSFICYLIYKKETQLENKIYPNVYVNNINFGLKKYEDILGHYSNKNQLLSAVVFNISLDGETIATFSGSQVDLGFDSKGIADRAYLVGRSTKLLSRIYQKLASLFLWDKFKIVANIDYNKQFVQELITGFEEKYNIPAKNALFQFENDKVTSFRQEEKGQKIESDKFQSDLNTEIQKLKDNPKNINIKVFKKVIYPEITLAKANNFGIEEFIAEGKSDYTHSIPERVHNIILATSKFHGVLMPKSKVFSFNDTIGDISYLTGYKQAYIIKEGKTVLGDGGGVCQVSTTLFRAALNAGLPIVERHAHAYRVGYYENDAKPGLDATTFSPSVDLKIENNTQAAILIQTEVDTENNLLYFRFYGKKDNRVTTISPITVFDIQPPGQPIYQDDPTIKRGITKQVDFPAWGSKAKFDYKVTLDGKTLVDTTFFSVYKPWQAVYLVGVGD